MVLTSLKVLEHSFSPAEPLPSNKKQFIWGLLNDCQQAMTVLISEL
jgi:hypothetical protein